jgi:hypothetical protein
LGQPLAKAKVYLDGITVKGVKLTTRTAPDGSYAFNNLEPGIYLLRVKKFIHFPRTVIVEFKKNKLKMEDINLLF